MPGAVDGLLAHLTADRAALVRRQTEADRVVAASSAGHLVHEMSVHRRPWQVDPVPFLLDASTFARLAAGVADRAAALERIVADLYGDRALVADGVVPGEALSSTTRYRIDRVGLPPRRRWLTNYAVDLVQLTDGTWRVVRDLTDAPTGIGYALLDRAAMLPSLDDAPLGAGGRGELGVASLAGVAAVLRRALVDTTIVPSPRIVLLTGGVEHAGYVEDSQLARLLGFTLVEGADLVVRQGRVWLRTLGGLDPVDVLYRRVGDDEADPIELAAPGGGGVPGLLSAVASGGVELANAHGCGLLEDPELAAYWPAAAAAAGTELRLPQLGAAAGSASLTTYPSFRGGDLDDAAVVLRLHVVCGPDGATVVPGGNGRVLAVDDDPRRPTARLVKDVWVLDPTASLPPIVTVLPQVDLAASVPTRAAAAMYWTGRAAERAEAIARTMRVVATRRRQDPLLVTADGGRWARRAAAALIAATAGDGTAAGSSPRAPVLALEAATQAAAQALGQRLRVFVADAASVGEFLSGTTARVLTEVAALVEPFGAGRARPADVDDVLASLAAFAGAWNESTVRGPAWRLGDIGVRLERALVVTGLAGALAGSFDDPLELGGDPAAGVGVDAAGAASLEVLLAANESLVAYRRQHRSDVALEPALELLLRDHDNPRGFAACMDRLAEHVADIGWRDGDVAVVRLAAMVEEVSAETLASPSHLVAVRATVGELATLVGDTWFATPVKPMLMGAGRAAQTLLRVAPWVAR